jgi:hypothetical protein
LEARAQDGLRKEDYIASFNFLKLLYEDDSGRILKVFSFREVF